jgi:hypothetical protein
MKRDGLARVRAIAVKLPDVEEGTTFGYPAFKVGGKLMAWFPVKKEVEPGSLGVRMSILEREHRIAAEPDIYYVTPHYKDYDSVLARVDLMSDKALRELLESGHEFMVASGKRTAKGTAKRPARKSAVQRRTR